jgi:hypothetical protein
MKVATFLLVIALVPGTIRAGGVDIWVPGRLTEHRGFLALLPHIRPVVRLTTTKASGPLRDPGQQVGLRRPGQETSRAEAEHSD